MPNKGEVIGRLKVFRGKYADIYKRGLRPKWSHKEWKGVLAAVKKSIRRNLIKTAKIRAKAVAAKQAKKAAKVAARKGSKAIPGWGTIIAIGFAGADLWAGESLGDVIANHGTDAIPIVGTVKGAYGITVAGVEASRALAEVFNVDVSEDQITEKMWEELENELSPAAG